MEKLSARSEYLEIEAVRSDEHVCPTCADGVLSEDEAIAILSKAQSTLAYWTGVCGQALTVYNENGYQAMLKYMEGV